MLALHPWAHRDGFDGLHRSVSFCAGLGQGVEVLAVVRALHRHVVVWKQHGVEVESVEAPPVRGCDLRSMTGDPDPLDQAFLAGRPRVRVIHGHGKGILMRTLHEMFAGHPQVEKFYAAAPREGGTGATVVELRV